MASIAKREDGKYRARYRDPAGKQHARHFTRKVDATAWLDKIRGELVKGDYIDPAGAKTIFDEWAQRVHASTVNLRPSTRARDDSCYRVHVEPAFGGLPLGAIDHLAVREWIAALSASELSAATVQKCAQVLAKIMRAAVDAGLIASSPCERQPLPRIERQEMLFLGPDEIVRLADAIDEPYRPLVLVGAYSGLRAGELFALRRGRVDLLRGRVDVAETLVEVRGQLHFGPPKTRAGLRSVPLPRSVVDVLTTHVAGLEPGELVFPSAEGGPVWPRAWRRRVWHPGCVAAGLGTLTRDEQNMRVHYEGLRLHDLRHTAVALWIAAGASPKEVAVRAGHTSVSTVLDRYGHLLAGTEERTTEALDVMAKAATTTPRVADVTALR
jgi:integrase